MKIALYIPCFNAEKTIQPCLSAVFSQTRLADDIMVIDDGSSDSTVEKAKMYPVRIIRHAKNLGLAAARNTAIRNTDAGLVASLDSDCKPGREWLYYLEKCISSSAAAGAGGKTIEARSPSVLDKWRTVHMTQHWGDSRKINPSFLFGSNTLFRREPLLKCGSYNEKYRNNFEDVDISGRLRKKGYKLVYEPRATVSHLRKDNLASLLNNFWKWNFAYYVKSGFYRNAERFDSKIKDNLGLSNRFLEEDLRKKRLNLLYIDFLIAIHHSLRDFDYFSFCGERDKFYITTPSRLSLWLSLVDITFFQHFDRSKSELNTLIPKNNNFQQNFIALALVLSLLFKTKFGDKKFNRMIYKHMLISIHRIYDAKLLDKINNLFELHNDWGDLMRKKHPNINRRFLEVLSANFMKWVDVLIYRFPNITGLIKKSAEYVEQTTLAA
jgi:GT2 family glycosyltransferase